MPSSPVVIRSVPGCSAVTAARCGGRAGGGAARCGGRAGGGGGGGAVLLVLLVALLGAHARAVTPPARLCPPCTSHALDCKQQNKEPILNDECYYHIYNASLTISTHPKFFTLRCPRGVLLNSTSLPTFPTPAVVSKVTLYDCALPDEPYAVALRRLNITVVDYLGLFNVPGADLREDHFQNLTELTELDIRANKLMRSKSNNTLTPLVNLKYLSLDHVELPSSLRTLENLTTLETLKLNACQITELRKNVLCKLPTLKKMTIHDDSLTSILDSEEPCNITTVSLKAGRLTNLPSFGGVQSLLLINTQILQIKGCSQIENLTVNNRYTTRLPDQWLVQCRRLKRLTLNLEKLKGPVPDDLLSSAVALHEFKLSGCKKGIQLADGFFTNTRKLKILNLSENKLEKLPSLSLMELDTLDLSHNRLTAGALLQLQGQKSLQVLMLQDNPLGDLCHLTLQRSSSILEDLISLRELSLAKTNATRICTDWQLYMRSLNKLYLEDNHINLLEWQDLQNWNRNVEVRLKRNGLTTILMDETNYKNPGDRSGSTAKFIMDERTPLLCDCKAYWFAKAVKDQRLPVAFEGLHCLGPSSVANYNDIDYIDSYETETNPNLLSFDLDLMVCYISTGCPEGCLCILQPQNSSILIECTNSPLGIMPNVVVTSLEKELQNSTMKMRINNRNISVLPESISPQVRELDVRNNSLRADDARTARALVAGRRRAWLAGNPLDCRCGGPLLHALRAHISQIIDVDDVHCADGRPLSDALSAECGVTSTLGASGSHAVWWGVGGAVLALLLAGAATAALQRPARLRLKAFLLARGLCLSWVLPDDDDECKYDAFLSYAHEDEQLASALVAELESGARPLRLCVHHRDWQPGEWIPKQIAQSVKESRRTIILLSENFAKSSWARAEFREAYAHALRDDAVRLVVVVVGAAPPAGLDPDIQHYVTNNTYVRWGEPAFWEKLRLALPAYTSRFKTAKPDPRPPPPPPPRTDLPAHPPPQPPTPVVKFAHIDFPAPIKPAKNSAPPCA
ncbi:hypothetical protein O0L34_g19021 [Tuta absoluta]|nr:hypothetical protein O0L34_g19021 [Tuta absoluta]